MEPYEPGVATVIVVEEFHHKDKYLSTFRLNPGHFFVDSADPSHVNMLANFPSIKNMSEISSKFESKYLRRNSSCSWQRFLGDRFLDIFDSLPLMDNLGHLSNPLIVEWLRFLCKISDSRTFFWIHTKCLKSVFYKTVSPKPFIAQTSHFLPHRFRWDRKKMWI